MIRIDDVYERINKRPFEPFRVCLTDGRTYDITHPELCLPGRTTVHLAVPDPKFRRAVMRIDQCALVHIVRFEPLNGKRRRTSRRRNGKNR
jgi:hypothetical protein